jgi:hypothetical protein
LVVGRSGSETVCSEVAFGQSGFCLDNTDESKGKVGLCSETEERQAHELSEAVEECGKHHCSQGVR